MIRKTAVGLAAEQAVENTRRRHWEAEQHANTEKLVQEAVEDAVLEQTNPAAARQRKKAKADAKGVVPFFLFYLVMGGTTYSSIGQHESLAFLNFPGIGWLMGFAIFYCGIIIPARDVRWPYLPGIVVMLYPIYDMAPFFTSLVGMQENMQNVGIVASVMFGFWFMVLRTARTVQGFA
ncbi:hypothetical protein [Kordiimonas sp.]|uniref:hypothetical protein n=1 Tax=Kordiimonas sp. TaxID=1970157 RepID=UPI003B5196A6